MGSRAIPLGGSKGMVLSQILLTGSNSCEIENTKILQSENLGPSSVY